MPPPNAFLAWGGERGLVKRVEWRGGRVCVGGEGECVWEGRERGKEGESEEERESVCVERESVEGEKWPDKKKMSIHTREQPSKRELV